ncbi:thioredoxin domain-containing protein [Actinoplanes sp. NPDC051411]|uniref:DsbA family protein n=1 Tax=Actinoplanes sp. NPDC051411 TaxID=3155522 RepID=UPI0034279C86
MSKGDRARERNNARRIVEQQRAAERRRRVTVWTSVAVVVVLVAAGLIGWAVLSHQDKTTASKLTVPAGVVDDGTAWKIGTGPVKVDLYEDFMCPICHNFENQTGATIKQLVSQNKITVQYHTVAILDDSSNGTKYSTRAAGAAAAAATEGKFVEYHDALYANQPEEGSNGLTNAKLIDIGKSAGLTDDAFVNAVNKQTYDAWVANVTNQFTQRGFTGTPTIVVNGKVLQGPNQTVPTTELFTQTVDAAAG